MSMEAGSGYRAARRLRRTARAVGAVVGGFWVLMGIGHAVFDPVSWTFEGMMIAGLTAAA